MKTPTKPKAKTKNKPSKSDVIKAIASSPIAIPQPQKNETEQCRVHGRIERISSTLEDVQDQLADLRGSNENLAESLVLWEVTTIALAILCIGTTVYVFIK